MIADAAEKILKKEREFVKKKAKRKSTRQLQFQLQNYKNRRQSALIIMGRGPTPDASISACYLTLYPDRVQGWKCSRLRWGHSFYFAFSIFTKIFPSQCCSALVIHNARHTQEVDTWGWKCLCGRWAAAATCQSTNLLASQGSEGAGQAEGQPSQGK